MARLKDWAQLVRVPNTLTASADSLAGFSLGAGAWQLQDAFPLVAISLASISLYWAGMVLNDVNDIDRDRLERRNGPLVDDRIAWHVAAKFGWGLIICGVLLAILAGFGASVQPRVGGPASTSVWALAPAGMALLLGCFVVAYDSALKMTWMGPWLMGLCRAANLSMGIALGLAASADPLLAVERMGGAMFLVPIGHGLFVVGLTLAARKETKLEQSAAHLVRGWGLSVVGVLLIAAAASTAGNEMLHRLSPTQGYPFLVGLMVLPWLNRAIQSVQHRTVPTLVAAIKQAIVTILFLDAAVALQFAGTWPGVIVCLLVIPTFLLGRWFRMT